MSTYLDSNLRKDIEILYKSASSEIIYEWSNIIFKHAMQYWDSTEDSQLILEAVDTYNKLENKKEGLLLKELSNNCHFYSKELQSPVNKMLARSATHLIMCLSEPMSGLNVASYVIKALNNINREQIKAEREFQFREILILHKKNKNF